MYPKKRKKFKSLGEVLNRTLDRGIRTRSFSAHTSKKIAFSKDSFDFLTLIRNWETVVGENLANNTLPHKIQNSTLFILVKHAHYAQQLSFLSEEIKRKIIQAYPILKTSLKKIYFRNAPDFFEELKVKQEKQLKKPRPKEKCHPFSPHYRLLKQQAEQEFADIEDDELKRVLVSLKIQSDFEVSS